MELNQSIDYHQLNYFYNKKVKIKKFKNEIVLFKRHVIIITFLLTIHLSYLIVQFHVELSHLIDYHLNIYFNN